MRVHLGTLWTPLRYVGEFLLKVKYLSLGAMSFSFGRVLFKTLNPLNCNPALSIESMLWSTSFNLWRCLYLRADDSLQGIFLIILNIKRPTLQRETHRTRPPKFTRLAFISAEGISVREKRRNWKNLSWASAKKIKN